MRKLAYTHLFAGKSHEPAIELAERLKAIAPMPVSKVLFACSGSESNDTLIKLIWYYNNAKGRREKKKIISRQKAYHGVTIASASMTGLVPVQRDFDLPVSDRFIYTDCPHYYHGAQPGESEEDFATRMAANLEALIEKEGPETIAAMFAEPIMGAGGVIVPPATYFEKIDPILKKHDILLVTDEVICGFGRTANMFGCETFNMNPDFMTVAKALSSGYLPISAVTIPEKVFEAMQDESRKIGTFGHGYTYGGHPVSAAVAAKTLELYEKRDILGHVRKMTPTFQKRLKALEDHPLVGETVGRGLIGGIELVADKATHRNFDARHGIAGFCGARCHHHGLVVRPLAGDRVAICPPLIINEAEINELFDRYGRALDDTLDHVTKNNLAAV
jgi:4-aminobutyrate--pyruvate transaminase